jgi:hypothetical protein
MLVTVLLMLLMVNYVTEQFLDLNILITFSV